jgi:hypothetical protein
MHGTAELCIQFQLLQINLISDHILFCIHFLSKIKTEVMYNGMIPMVSANWTLPYLSDIQQAYHEHSSHGMSQRRK